MLHMENPRTPVFGSDNRIDSPETPNTISATREVKKILKGRWSESDVVDGEVVADDFIREKSFAPGQKRNAKTPIKKIGYFIGIHLLNSVLIFARSSARLLSGQSSDQLIVVGVISLTLVGSVVLVSAHNYCQEMMIC
ncbi:hypothetical protein QTN25_009427 [Entamoeba marina]